MNHDSRFPHNSTNKEADGYDKKVVSRHCPFHIDGLSWRCDHCDRDIPCTAKIGKPKQRQQRLRNFDGPKASYRKLLRSIEVVWKKSLAQNIALQAVVGNCLLGPLLHLAASSFHHGPATISGSSFSILHCIALTLQPLLFHHGFREGGWSKTGVNC